MMKHRKSFIAVAALVLLLGAVAYFGGGWGGWNLRLPQIEMTSAVTPNVDSSAKADAVVANDAGSRTTGFAPWGSADKQRSAPSEPARRIPRESEALIPYWCFRTYFPGLPWMMSTHERNTGNAARSDSEYIWNGERSLRMHFEPIEDTRGQSPLLSNAQRNVLWQAIGAEPFRGKRIVFRPYLRAMPGGRITAFLRSWDGSTGTPQLSVDRIDPAKTPTATWGSAWGNPRLMLAVPADAKVIYYGIVQSGARPVWIDHVEVSADTQAGALGNSPNSSRYLDEVGRNLENLPPLPIDANWVWETPKNLDFEMIYRKEDVATLEDTPPLPC